MSDARQSNPTRRLRLAVVVVCGLALSVGVTSATASSSPDERTTAKSVPNGSVTTPKLAFGAVTTPKIRNRAVTTPKLRNGAVKGPKIANGTVGRAKLAPNARTLYGTIAPAGVNPQVVRGFGVTGVSRFGSGDFAVQFNRNVTNCSWFATYGPPGDSFVSALWATVRATGDPNTVEVVLRNADGAQADGSGFHVQVLCP